jgi:coenzyme F420-0:L-glutamate ligase / coenzyme F420-1:gamma-L-glutamate ligase
MDSYFVSVSSAHLDLIRTRRSVRRYERTPLTRQLVDLLIQAMSWAPSAHNRQPWRVAILEDDKWKRHLASKMAEQLRRDRSADGDGAAIVDADVKRSYDRITEAPVVLVVCADIVDMDVYPDQRRENAEYLMAVQSVATAAQNLMLAAHAEGLGACWMCAPLFCQDTVSAALRLPSGWQPQALITLGWPSATKKFRPRRLPAEFAWRPSGLPNGQSRA